MNFLNKIFSKINLHQKTWKVPAIRMNSNITEFNEALKIFDDIMLNIAISNEDNTILMTIWDENYEYTFKLDQQILKYINKKNKYFFVLFKGKRTFLVLYFIFFFIFLICSFFNK